VIKCLYVVIAILILPIVTHAQSVVDGITIPATHPALFFNSARLTTAQTWFGTHAFSCGGTDYLCMAFHDLVSGTNTNTSTVYTWASGYSMPVIGVSCDNCRFDGEDLIMVFDWEYNNLTGGQRSTLISAYNTWITHWMSQSWGGPTMPQSNYFWGYTRNELEWGITSYNDQNSTAKGFLDDALTTRGTNAFQPTTIAGGNGAGGLPQEGDEYGRYEVWYPVIPFVTTNFDGRDVYGEYDRYFKTTVCMYAYATSLNPMEVIIGGTDQSVSKWELMPFSDDELYQTNVGTAEANFSGIGGSGSYIGDFMNTMSNYYASLDIGKYAKQWLTNLTASLSGPAYHIQSVDPGTTTAKAFSNLPLDYYATGNQYFYGHSSWATTNSTEFMMQMGSPSGIGHVHDDFGNWQMRRNGAATPAYWGSRETVGYAQDYAPYGNPTVWTATHAYSTNARVLPSPANGFAYQQIAANCTSGGSQPTFPTAALGTVMDGTCNWINTTNGLNGDSVAVSDLTVHNGVLMNGLGIAYNFKDATPTVYRLETQAGYSYADVELTGSYHNTTDFGSRPERSNVSAGHVEREYIFVRSLETLVILDRVLANAVSPLTAAQINKTFVSHCEVAWVLEDASHERCDNGTQTLRTTSLLPASFTQRTVTESTCTNSQSACSTGGQFRLELDSTDNCAQSYLLNVMQSRAGAGSNLTASVTDSNSGCANVGTGTLTVTLHPSAGSDTTIVFNKATCSTTVPSQCSTGGTINVAAGGAVSLSTTIEGISYTDSGPVWNLATVNTGSVRGGAMIIGGQSVHQ
jgi:hypothetical protein